MNFFESQDRVRKNTFQLILLLTLAVVTLIVMTNLLVMVVFGYIDSQQMQSRAGFFQQLDWQTFTVISAGVIVVVLFGSLYKILTLSAGGKSVAESLGGQLIPRNTNDPGRRKLLNVVEEMAIASGTPAPPVYVLADEPGINAFAAGFSPRDAVIGVTQGTIDQLNRDQLQGVIAHEFSHIFNGDMRLNIRLIGILNGILVIGMAGYYLLYSASYSRRGRGGDKGAILALAIGLMVIGFAGTFFGGLIKSAVSRQREYLADASAVQFTRNPDGIAGALKRIGGLESGSRVENPGAAEVSHAFFAQGISGFMQSLSATHPPLDKRILRIDPDWDGEYTTAGKAEPDRDEAKGNKRETMTREALSQQVATVLTGAAVADVANAIDQIGNPSQVTISHARTLVTELPTLLRDSAREPYGARAVIYSLVLDKGQGVRDRQLRYLQKYADPDVLVATHRLLPEMARLGIKFRLPLIDIAIPALKQLSLNQYQVFRDNLVALIEMDSKIELLEWTLQKILFNHLDGQFYATTPMKSRYSRIGQLKNEVELLLSAVAYASDQDRNEIESAFNDAARTLEISGLQLVESDKIDLSSVDRALQKLAALKPLAKPRLLMACATAVVHDRKISAVEVELLRACSDVLDCPMPPIIG